MKPSESIIKSMNDNLIESEEGAVKAILRYLDEQAEKEQYVCPFCHLIVDGLVYDSNHDRYSCLKCNLIPPTGADVTFIMQKAREIKPIKIRDGLFIVGRKIFDGRFPIGIVVVNDEERQEHRAYIGYCPNIMNVIVNGAKFPLEIAKQLIASEDL